MKNTALNVTAESAIRQNRLVIGKTGSGGYVRVSHQVDTDTNHLEGHAGRDANSSSCLAGLSTSRQKEDASQLHYSQASS